MGLKVASAQSDVRAPERAPSVSRGMAPAGSSPRAGRRLQKVETSPPADKTPVEVVRGGRGPGWLGRSADFRRQRPTAPDVIARRPFQAQRMVFLRPVPEASGGRKMGLQQLNPSVPLRLHRPFNPVAVVASQ